MSALLQFLPITCHWQKSLSLVVCPDVLSLSALIHVFYGFLLILSDGVVSNVYVINDCVIAGLLPNLLSYCQMLLSMSAFPSPTDTIKDLRNFV